MAPPLSVHNRPQSPISGQNLRLSSLLSLRTTDQARPSLSVSLFSLRARWTPCQTLTRCTCYPPTTEGQNEDQICDLRFLKRPVVGARSLLVWRSDRPRSVEDLYRWGSKMVGLELVSGHS
ncbi:hypothetical protein F8388_019733 [Cannabis sativa]|uniref:Uncharacterized protein n=2 Tax=Cannabis sativa TaxID=3483 RepID=A0A7J6ED12_CANSA|nr:hypothetical protein F8388_019733 [Cannabis sativa]